MDKIRIIGGNRLNGKVSISGSKNSSLPIMISSILTDDVLQIHNVPKLTDIKTLTFILGGAWREHKSNQGKKERSQRAYFHQCG